jgi:hypothetical protein
LAKDNIDATSDSVSSKESHTCHAEFIENGKTIHYLYNPDEKDAAKAWKKSDKCN